jgi:vacuolar-type H+-ATPase subunit E/Vma4
MAWLNTDWSKELNQVEDKISTILDEKVEPLLERMVAKASTEITVIVAKADYELRDNTDRFLKEIEVQRRRMVAEMKSVVRYAAIAAFIVVVASVALIKLVNSLW